MTRFLSQTSHLADIGCYSLLSWIYSSITIRKYQSGVSGKPACRQAGQGNQKYNMITELLSNPLSFLIWLIALLVALTVHEFSHAAMADQLGDPTARLAGRKTLNPLAHLDPIGTLMLMFFRVGWGKPVPVDDYNLKNPRRDAALISLAGPASNLALAVLLSLLLRLPTIFNFQFSIFNLLLPPIIILNVALGIFNLLPIHPLDGAKILLGVLDNEQAYQLELFYRQFGLILLVFLLFPFFGTSPIIAIIWPIINFIIRILVPGGTELI